MSRLRFLYFCLDSNILEVFITRPITAARLLSRLSDGFRFSSISMHIVLYRVVNIPLCLCNKNESLALINAFNNRLLLSRFNYDTMPSLKLLNISIAVSWRFFLMTYYFTLWPWPFTCDLQHLQSIACDVMKLFERNQAIRGVVIAISIFDLFMTLNAEQRVALGFVIIFTKFDIRQL